MEHDDANEFTHEPPARLKDQLPEELVDALRREQAIPDLTPAADRAVIAAAKQHFANRAEPQRRYLSYAAAAAIAVLGVVFALQYRAPDPSALLYTDVDNSGRIDIADVLALAQRDVDSDDLDAFAATIVSLNIDENST